MNVKHERALKYTIEDPLKTHQYVVNSRGGSCAPTSVLLARTLIMKKDVYKPILAARLNKHGRFWAKLYRSIGSRS